MSKTEKGLKKGINVGKADNIPKLIGSLSEDNVCEEQYPHEDGVDINYALYLTFDNQKEAQAFQRLFQPPGWELYLEVGTQCGGPFTQEEKTFIRCAFSDQGHGNLNLSQATEMYQEVFGKMRAKSVELTGKDASRVSGGRDCISDGRGK